MAAVQEHPLGLIDHWLRQIQDLRNVHAAVLDGLSAEDRIDRLCELNVHQQVAHLSGASVVRDAWRRGQPLELHGLIYSIKDGILRDLGSNAANASDADALIARHARSR
jgi:carbonic anhydrase